MTYAPETQPDQMARDPSGPSATRHVRGGLVGAVGLVLALLVAGAFGLVAVLAHAGAPSAHSTAPGTGSSSASNSNREERPAPGCPAPPHAASGPQVYWATASPEPSSRYARPQALCGIGFVAGEQVTLSVASTTGQPSHEPSTNVTANADGAFAADYVPVVLCGEAGSQLLVQARGDKGSNATVPLPPSLPTGCPPA